jgi:uncharacterized membrane protein
MLLLHSKLLKYILLFFVGGFLYSTIEIFTIGHSHISMLAAGGISFILIGLINEVFTWDMALISQMVISAAIITVVEFIFGLIVNVWLKLNVWDYSTEPYNIMGQICLLYTNIWFLLSIFGILLDDYLRYYILKEEKPRYKIF